MVKADLVVVGGGIVGLASARAWLLAHPGARVVLLEKESELAAHQTGRNSGVIHSGLYYKPGSAKARTCRRGKALLERYCAEKGVRMETCGKVVVAVDESELAALARIEERGIANGVQLTRISRERLHELEPHMAGIAALHVPETGIVDYVGMCRELAADIRALGSEIVTDARVFHIDARADGITVASTAREVHADRLLNCAGLHSDRIAELAGLRVDARIVPFRGEYFELTPAAEQLCRNLVYPVPDPNFPFLGVHFTRMAKGGVECGPNAVLAFAREGYDLSTVDWADLSDALSYPGFWRLVRRHWRAGSGELWRSFSKQAFVRALQRLCPEIRPEHLHAAPAGVRAQALTPDGALVDDFRFVRGERMLHVLNAPSPAATASLAIGEEIAQELIQTGG
ncbi:MAG: hypothetical protein RL277_1222 [Planctomycetota bacterium]|jgi:L-2-hydroxyglutarate oxidase